MSINYIDSKGTSYEIIHNDSKGKISIAATVGGVFKPLVYGKFGSIKMPEVNSFFSINTFTGLRKTQNLFELKANFFEVDLNYDEDKEKFLWEYRKGCYDIPTPTLVISSGHGIWFLFLYKDAPICRKNGVLNTTMIKKWKLIQKALSDRIAEDSPFKVDERALDVARVMRSTGTTNIKPGLDPVPVEIIEYNPDALYTMDELLSFFTGMTRQEYFDAQAKAKAPKKTNKSQNRKSNYNLYKTNHNRVTDLEKLVKIRKNGFFDGCRYRELYLFVYAYHVQILTQNMTETLDRVRELNSLFTDPLPDKELTTAVTNTVEQAVKSREIVILTGPYAGKRMGYNYKTETLIDMLEITPEEQQQLKTLCNAEVKYDRNKDLKRANRRNSNGMTDKQQQKLNDTYAAHCYFEQGKTVTEIADIIGVNKATISRFLKLDKPEARLITASDIKKTVVA